MFAFLIPLTGCYTTNQNQIDGYGYYRFGSNSYNVWNVQNQYLTTDDSQCVVKSKSVLLNDQVVNKVSRECVEVTKLGEDKYVSQMFFNLMDSFFNSGSGMMLFSGLLELL